MAKGNGGASYGGASYAGANNDAYAESRVASISVDDIIRAAKAAGVRLTDSDVVAIACAQVPGGWGTRPPMCVPAKGSRR